MKGIQAALIMDQRARVLGRRLQDAEEARLAAESASGTQEPRAVEAARSEADLLRDVWGPDGSAWGGERRVEVERFLDMALMKEVLVAKVRHPDGSRSKEVFRRPVGSGSSDWTVKDNADG